MEVSDRYSYRVFWSEEDGEHVAVCAELPGLSWLDKKAERALTGVLQAAREAIELLRDKGQSVPEPLIDRRYSGTFRCESRLKCTDGSCSKPRSRTFRSIASFPPNSPHRSSAARASRILP